MTLGQETTADEVLAGVDLSGRRALVTGGSSGIGAETARALAAAGADVTITARNLDAAAEVTAGIEESTGRRVGVVEMELGSLASVRAAAERVRETHDELHLLINNAGVMACPYATTADGFELQFGTNHLGHFVLTGMLTPLLLSSAPARVVTLSSAAHQNSPVRFDDLMFDAGEYEKWEAYGQSKTANALHALELDRRLADRGVRAFSVHPGIIITPLARHLTEDDFAELGKEVRNTNRFVKSVEQGAATSVWAAMAPELDAHGGQYLADCRVAPTNDEERTTSEVRSYAQDPDAARRLWEISEELVGQTFDV